MKSAPNLASQRDDRRLWRNLTARLDTWRADWRDLIEHDPQPPKHVCPDIAALSGEAIFEAFAVAALSGNTRWDRVAAVREELREPFQDFSPNRYAALGDAAIEGKLVPWFRQRRAGSPRLRATLARLRHAAAMIGGGGRELLAGALAEAGGSPEQIAMLLGASRKWKMPGFGIALAAEALRLLGFDLCKPDRHILRAVGAWGYVSFARWVEKGNFTPPDARPAELLATMCAVRGIAEANDLGVSYANSVIWLAGAVSGARLTNDEFGALIRPSKSP